MIFYLSALAGILSCIGAACATPLQVQHTSLRNASYPVAIWHGLGDRYDNPGLVALGNDIKEELGEDTFVYMIRVSNDSNTDQKSTLFGNMYTELEIVAEQLKGIEEFKLGFDAIGLSQGGVFLRGYVEKYGTNDDYPKIRNLITLGSPHMGISSSPPCRPTDFFCKATQWALKAGVWTPYAQNGVVPAQYFRNQLKIQDYLSHNSFLRDINNERWNDTQPVSGASREIHHADEDGDEDTSPRNQSYRKAIASLNNFVLIAFDNDMTVIPFTSPLFTLPSADDPEEAIPYADLPLYAQDYIGLKKLDYAGGLHQDTCHGQHMEINSDCWKLVIKWLGKNGDARGARVQPDTHSEGLLVQTY